jgi:hypothetical protein
MLTPESWLHSQLVVTTALILTFSPKRRDSDCMYLFIRLCVVRIQSRVLGGSGVQAASLMGGNLRTRGSREQRKPFLPRLVRLRFASTQPAGLAAPKRSVGGGEGRGEGGLQTKILPAFKVDLQGFEAI